MLKSGKKEENSNKDKKEEKDFMKGQFYQMMKNSDRLKEEERHE